MEEKIIAAVIVSAVAFFSVYALTPILIKVLGRRNLVVQDVNKKGSVMVTRPGGISIEIPPGRGIITLPVLLASFTVRFRFCKNLIKIGVKA